MNLVRIVYRPKKEHYILLRGRETFYDADNYLVSFGTPEDAAEWLRVNHPEYELDPDSAPREALIECGCDLCRSRAYTVSEKEIENG